MSPEEAVRPLSGAGGREHPLLALTRLQPSEEELYRRSFAPPEIGLAPGSREMARQQLQERIGEQDFRRLLGQKQAETIQMAQAGMHPAVQAQAEAEARRATYSAQSQARVAALQSLLGIERAREETLQAETDSVADRLVALYNAKARITDRMIQSQFDPGTEEGRQAKAFAEQELANTERQIAVLEQLAQAGYEDVPLEELFDDELLDLLREQGF